MSSRRRSAVVTGLAVTVVAGVGIVAFAALKSDDRHDVSLGNPTASPRATATQGEDVTEESPTTEASPSPSPSPVETAAEPVCESPDLRPAVLPWVNEGEEVPPPDIVHEGDEGSYVAWLGDGEAVAGPDRSWEGPVVSLAVLASPGWEPGSEPGSTQVQVRGEVADVAWVGDPGVGELAVRWRETGDECGVHSVTALTSGDWGPALGSPFQAGERCVDPAEEDFDECYETFVEAMEAAVVRVAQSLDAP